MTVTSSVSVADWSRAIRAVDVGTEAGIGETERSQGTDSTSWNWGVGFSTG